MKNEKQTSMSLTPLISECERIANAAIKHFGLTVKPESLVFTIQTKGRKNALGWFWAGRWKSAEKGATAVNEINLSAETLRECEPGEVIIHELAHAENNALGIKDCSKNQCHNKKFKTMAEKLGLVVNEKRDKRFGFGFTKLGPAATDFLAKTKFDREIFKVNRLLEGAGNKQTTRLVKCECECGCSVRITRKWLDTAGAPLCGCGKGRMEYEIPESLGGEEQDND